MGSASRIYQHTAPKRGSASKIYQHTAPKKGGLPLEFINIQPPKTGLSLEFINKRDPIHQKGDPPLGTVFMFSNLLQAYFTDLEFYDQSWKTLDGAICKYGLYLNSGSTVSGLVFL